MLKKFECTHDGCTSDYSRRTKLNDNLEQVHGLHNASAVAVFVEWWIVTFVDIVAFH